MPSTRCGSSSASRRSRPRISEYSRRHSHRRLVVAGVELGQRGVERAAAGGARRERAVGVLALEHERLARELLGALADRRRRPARSQPGKCFQPDGLLLVRERSGPGCAAEDSGPRGAARSARRCRRSSCRERRARRVHPDGRRPTYYSTRTATIASATLRPCMRRVCPILACAPLLLAGCGSDEPGEPRRAPDRRSSPERPGAAGRAARPGERAARRRRGRLRARIATLRGYPVVVNKWASWCGPAAPSSRTSRAGGQARQEGRLPRRRRQRQRRTTRRSSSTSTRCRFPSYKDPDLQDRRDSRRCGLPLDRLLRLARASWPT